MDVERIPVIVEWHDAHVGTDGWEERASLEDDGPAVIHSIGYLLGVDTGGKENHVSLVQTWSADDMVHSVFHIPKQMVQRIEILVRSHELANAVVFSTEGSASWRI